MKVIPSYIKEWFYPPIASEDEIFFGLTQAKLKEVSSLAFEQVLLNDQYSPFTIEHPTKLSERASELIHYFSYTNAARQLESTYNLSLYQFQQLPEKDKVKFLLHFPVSGKNLLQQIGSFLNINSPSFIREISQNNPFYGSDLIVYTDTYYGPLPTNGIYQKDFSNITALYNQIANNKTPITIHGSFGFQVHVLSAFKKLMTRSLGRELIYNILKPGWIQYFKGLFWGIPQNFTVDIFPHNSSCFVNCLETVGKEFVFTVNLCEKGRSQVYVEQAGKLGQKTEKSPFYISLAHELIHVKHSLLKKRFKSKDVNELHKFTNENEKVTITGQLNGKEEDGVSENSIREEFNFFPRLNHQGAVVDYYWV